MKKNIFRLATIVVAVVFATTAYGQNSDWYIAPSIAYSDDDGDRNIDDSVAGGQINAGRGVTEHISLEGALGYSDIDGFPGQKHLDISVNMLAFGNRDATFAPYFLVGIGYLGAKIEGAGDENRPTGTVGVGVIWRLGNSAVSIRAEQRARLAWEQGDNLTDLISTIGLQFSFGATKSAGKAKTGFDSDNDGVIDHWDMCPATKRGTAVDEYGCPLDSDKDGVADGIDACPDTPTGVQVDAVGCPPESDADRDGVADDKDKCPKTPAGAVVDIYGCERDGDGDRVVDRLDRCPNSPKGIRVDFSGCEIKDVIKLPGVNFANNSDRLLLGTAKILVNAAATLKKNPGMKIEVAGHTDSVGSAATNESLSERRAKTVRNYLLRYGANPASITARGYGERRPISDNTTAQGRAANRRVELIILN